MTTSVRGNTSGSTHKIQGSDGPPAPTTTAEEGVEDFPIEAEPGPAVDEFLKLAADEMGGMYVSDGDVETIMDKMATLTPGQQRAALEAMRSSGKLDTLCNECPDALRGKLCTALANAGMLSERGHATGATQGDGKTKAPDVPSLFSVPKGASDEVRKLAMATNTDRATTYRNAFVDYRDDYRQAVRDAPTIAKLRQLGPIQEPSLPLANPAGGPSGDYEKAATQMPDVKTAAIVTDKLYSLNQMSAPGFDVGIAVSAKLGYESKVDEKGGAQAKVQVELGASASSYRDGSTASSASAQAQAALGYGTDNGKQDTAKASSFKGVQVGAGVSRTTARDGTTTDNATAAAAIVAEKKAGLAGSAAQAGGAYDATTGNSASMGGNTLDKTGASMTVGEAGVSGQVSAKGTGVAVTAGPGSGSVAVAVAGQGASVAMGPDGTSVSATVGVPGAVQVSAGYSSGSVAPNGHHQGPVITSSATIGGAVGTGPVTAELQGTATMTMQLFSVDDVKLIIARNETGFFETPGELLRGTKFDDLSPEKQAIYKFYGWTKESWAAEQQRGHDKRSVAAQRAGMGR
jgi:hypothetical protein